jgi:hypothetical protein
VDEDSSLSLRAESVLMEGFRTVDEWPLIKRTITSYEMTFVRLAPLPASSAKDEEQAEAEATERRVYELIAPGRDVRKLIDLSCLGEFETCKVLSSLVQQEHLRALPPAGKGQTLGRDRSQGGLRLVGFLKRLALTGLVLAGLALFVTKLGSLGLVGSLSSATADPAVQRFIARQQIARIGAALAIYRLEQGELPEKLEALVSAGLLAREDLRFPWRDDYYYRRQAVSGFVLLPPLR